MYSRVSNWDFWLIKVAQAAQGKDFEWGYNDCATLARKCLVTILGVDPWKGHIGYWHTEIGALRIFSRIDTGKVLKNTGAHEVGNKFVTSGDLAIGPHEDMHQLIQVAVILPSRKGLTSSVGSGVEIIDNIAFTEDTEFWRYG